MRAEQDARAARAVLAMQHGQPLTIEPRPDPEPVAAESAASPDPWNSRAKGSTPEATARPRERHEQAVVDAALAILEAGRRKPGATLDHPQRVKDYLRPHLAAREREAFGVIFLDAAYGVIAFEVLFAGALTQTHAHPGVIARRAVVLNAASVMLAHNHPSGNASPSRADVVLTSAVRNALSLIDVHVLDHVLVGRGEPCSFAEHGLL